MDVGWSKCVSSPCTVPGTWCLINAFSDDLRISYWKGRWCFHEHLDQRPKHGLSIFHNSKLCIITQICWIMCHIWKKPAHESQKKLPWLKKTENCKLSWDKEMDFTILGVTGKKEWGFFEWGFFFLFFNYTKWIVKRVWQTLRDPSLPQQKRKANCTKQSNLINAPKLLCSGLVI